MDREALQIRSYRVCFELERRIYRIDRWRLPVSWGVPLRGVGYFVAALGLLLFARNLPVVGALLAPFPTPVKFCLLPIGIAYGLCAIRVDGRPAHSALLSVLRFHLGPRHVAGFARCQAPGTVVRFGELALAPDERGARLRRALVRGPARVLLRYPGAGREQRRKLVIEQTSGRPMWRGKTVALEPGQVLEVRS